MNWKVHFSLCDTWNTAMFIYFYIPHVFGRVEDSSNIENLTSGKMLGPFIYQIQQILTRVANVKVQSLVAVQPKTEFEDDPSSVSMHFAHTCKYISSENSGHV